MKAKGSEAVVKPCRHVAASGIAGMPSARMLRGTAGSCLPPARTTTHQSGLINHHLARSFGENGIHCGRPSARVAAYLQYARLMAFGVAPASLRK